MDTMQHFEHVMLLLEQGRRHGIEDHVIITEYFNEIIDNMCNKIEKYDTHSAEDRLRKLRGMQWKLNALRIKNANKSSDYIINQSFAMMWDSLSELNESLEPFRKL